MNFENAQKDMCESYLSGSAGIFISGIVWLLAGSTSIFFSEHISILIFFFGGMLIHPLSILFSKIFNRTGKHQDGNPLGKLALESTLLLFIGLFIAYSVFQINTNWFYPIMLLTIGVRYVIFQTIYGIKTYWLLGLVLIIAGIVSIITNQPFHTSAIIGGIIELIFAMIIFKQNQD